MTGLIFTPPYIYYLIGFIITASVIVYWNRKLIRRELRRWRLKELNTGVFKLERKEQYQYIPTPTYHPVPYPHPTPIYQDRELKPDNQPERKKVIDLITYRSAIIIISLFLAFLGMKTGGGLWVSKGLWVLSTIYFTYQLCLWLIGPHILPIRPGKAQKVYARKVLRQFAHGKKLFTTAVRYGKIINNNILNTNIRDDGAVAVDSTSMVVLKKNTVYRLVGRGVHFLRKNETFFGVIDLRPQVRSIPSVDARTKDRINIKYMASFRYQIDGVDIQDPLAINYIQNIYPPPFSISHSKIKLSLEQGLYSIDESLALTVEHNIASQVVKLINSHLVKYPLDQLVRKNTSKNNLRDIISNQVEVEIKKYFSKLGIKVLKVRIGQLKVPDEVSEKWIRDYQLRFTKQTQRARGGREESLITKKEEGIGGAYKDTADADQQNSIKTIISRPSFSDIKISFQGLFYEIISAIAQRITRILISIFLITTFSLTSNLMFPASPFLINFFKINFTLNIFSIITLLGCLFGFLQAIEQGALFLSEVMGGDIKSHSNYLVRTLIGTKKQGNITIPEKTCALLEAWNGKSRIVGPGPVKLAPFEYIVEKFDLGISYSRSILIQEVTLDGISVVFLNVYSKYRIKSQLKSEPTPKLISYIPFTDLFTAWMGFEV